MIRPDHDHDALTRAAHPHDQSNVDEAGSPAAGAVVGALRRRVSAATAHLTVTVPAR